jgi:hypothetical protein
MGKWSGSSFSSKKAAAARTVTVDVIGRCECNSSLVIGSEGTSDASLYMISTNVAFVPPSVQFGLTKNSLQQIMWYDSYSLGPGPRDRLCGRPKASMETSEAF